jgi:hypothetical protein
VKAPESVFFDAASGSLFVSQIGEGGPTGKDGDGYISKLTPEGKVVAAKWVTGFDSPKGLRSSGGKLWVSDIDQLIGIDIAQAKISDRILVSGAKFLNDVDCDAQGTVYVSDTFGGKIYQVKNGEVTVFAEGEVAESPNGLLVDGGRLLVAGWGSSDGEKKALGKLFALSLAKKEKTLITRQPLGNLDGLEVVGRNSYVVSDWMAGKIFYVGADGTANLLIQLPQGAADIAYLADRRLLIVPQMMENKVTAFDLSHRAGASDVRPKASAEPQR